MTTPRIAKANVRPRRQANQYNCTVTSLSMALEAVGIAPEECSAELVNKVLGALPLRGASWEQVAGAASHYGCRATLVVPSTLRQVRAWTDAGTPVLIGWNTGNEWSHASLIFDVTDDQVFIADPNIPNPDATVRILSHEDFYEKWWEKSGEGYKVRRPAMAIEREITPDGRQVMASADPDFQKFWDVELKKLSVKYNLSDPKRQVNFRIAVSSKTEDLKFSGLRELVKTWGGKSQGRTQQDFAFALADAWMKRQGRQVMASGPPRDADKVPGTDLFVSKEPSQSPWRGQKPQYKVYNRHGGVIGGSPDRAKAISMAKAEFSKTAKSKATKPTVKQTAEFLKKMGLKPPFDIIPRSKSGRNPVVVVTLEEDEAERVRMRAKAKRWNVRWEPQDDDQIQLAIRTDDQKPIPGLARVAFEKTAEAADCWSDYQAGGLSWGEYQQCLKRDRNRGRSRRDVIFERTQALLRWAGIAELMGNEKDAEFLTSVGNYVGRRGAPTSAQGAALDKIRKRYTRELQDPDRTLERLKAEKAKAEDEALERYDEEIAKEIPANFRRLWKTDNDTYYTYLRYGEDRDGYSASISIYTEYALKAEKTGKKMHIEVKILGPYPQYDNSHRVWHDDIYDVPPFTNAMELVMKKIAEDRVFRAKAVQRRAGGHGREARAAVGRRVRARGRRHSQGRREARGRCREGVSRRAAEKRPVPRCDRPPVTGRGIFGPAEARR